MMIVKLWERVFNDVHKGCTRAMICIEKSYHKRKGEEMDHGGRIMGNGRGLGRSIPSCISIPTIALLGRGGMLLLMDTVVGSLLMAMGLYILLFMWAIMVMPIDNDIRAFTTGMCEAGRGKDTRTSTHTCTPARAVEITSMDSL